MTGLLPKFDRPPVVEVAISIQFAHVPELTSAHLGWFWKQHLGEGKWPSVNEAHVLDDAFERFGSQREWMPSGGIKVSPANPRVRLQFVETGDEHMIQVQSTRFVYNWQKK